MYMSFTFLSMKVARELTKPFPTISKLNILMSTRDVNNIKRLPLSSYTQHKLLKHRIYESELNNKLENIKRHRRRQQQQWVTRQRVVEFE